MSAFKVFSGGQSPFDDAHKVDRKFVVLRDDDAEFIEVAFCSSKKRPQGAWLSDKSPAFAATGMPSAGTVGIAICRVRKDSVWVRSGRMIGVLNPVKDKHFAEDFVRALSSAQISVFNAKEAPLIRIPGRAPARDLEYQVVRFSL